MCWNEHFFKEQYFSELWQRKKIWKYFFVLFRSLATVYEISKKKIGNVCEKTRREISVFYRESFVLILRIFAAKPLQNFYNICFLFPGSWGTHHQIASQFKAFFVENEFFCWERFFARSLGAFLPWGSTTVCFLFQKILFSKNSFSMNSYYFHTKIG